MRLKNPISPAVMDCVVYPALIICVAVAIFGIPNTSPPKQLHQEQVSTTKPSVPCFALSYLMMRKTPMWFPCP